jgi:hypothetical protein
MRCATLQLGMKRVLIRRIVGILMMIGGPALILSSPSLVFSLGPLHSQIYDQCWIIGQSGCNMVESLNKSAAITWVLAPSMFGVVALFAGLWLFRSARHHKIYSRDDTLSNACQSWASAFIKLRQKYFGGTPSVLVQRESSDHRNE